MLKLARLLKSDQAAVLVAVVGTLAQAFHTRKIVLYSSTLEQPWQEIQALGLAFFFSFSLMIYTFRAGAAVKLSDKMKYMRYANLLFVLEWLINWHYYIRRFIVEPVVAGTPLGLLNYYDLGIALVYGFFLPYLIKTYAGNINIPSKQKENVSNFVDELATDKGIEFDIVNYNAKDKKIQIKL
jgi:hypothetical protein